MAIDTDRLMVLMGRLVQDFGAMVSIGPMIIGEKLGLYKAMTDGVPVTAGELAAKTSTNERYVREWLCAQAASGFVEYDASADRFSMTEEQAAALGTDGGPFYFLGAIDCAIAMVKDEPKILEAFRTGKGVGWHEHDSCLFRGTERFFRPGYMRHLHSRTRRCPAETRSWWTGRRRGLWAWGIHDSDGTGIPEQSLLGI